jgi:hypothetical protein
MRTGLKFAVDAGVVLGVGRGVDLLLARLRMHTRSYPSDVEDLTSSIIYLSDIFLNKHSRVVLEINSFPFIGAIKIFLFQ